VGDGEGAGTDGRDERSPHPAKLRQVEPMITARSGRYRSTAYPSFGEKLWKEKHWQRKHAHRISGTINRLLDTP